MMKAFNLLSNKYSEHKHQAKAKSMFNINVPFHSAKGEKSHYSNYFGSTNTELAAYLWKKGNIEFYPNKIAALSKRYNLDYGTLVSYCLCHEAGHAKEQKLFEKIGFFPNTLEIPYHIFIAGIFDFSINKELLKRNMKNPFARNVLLDKETVQYVNCYTEDERTNFCFKTLIGLPFVLDIYEHAGLSREEKKDLKQKQEKIIGNKWQLAHNKLKSVEFYHPEDKLAIATDMLKEILEVSVFKSKVFTHLLRLRNPNLPKFWKENTYHSLEVIDNKKNKV